MTQSEPRVIDAGDMPDYLPELGDVITAKTNLLTEYDVLEELKSPSTPKEMHRHLLDKAHKRAVVASENAYDACDWLALLDQTTADRYRKSARHLYELSEHLAVLIEES